MSKERAMAKEAVMAKEVVAMAKVTVRVAVEMGRETRTGIKEGVMEGLDGTGTVIGTETAIATGTEEEIQMAVVTESGMATVIVAKVVMGTAETTGEMIAAVAAAVTVMTEVGMGRTSETAHLAMGSDRKSSGQSSGQTANGMIHIRNEADQGVTKYSHSQA